MADNCCVCEKVIHDNGKKKQDSVLCDGSCKGWIHRVCAGLSTTVFKQISDSVEPYLCNFCYRDQHKQTVASLQEKIAYLESPPPQHGSESAPSKPLSYAQAASVTTNETSTLNSQNYERKYNVVIHGISEADKGTARQVRSKHDHEKVVTTLKKLDSDISPHYTRLLSFGKIQRI